MAKHNQPGTTQPAATAQMQINNIMDSEVPLKEQSMHAIASHLLFMIGGKHDTLSEDEEVMPQVQHYTGTMNLARALAQDLQAELLQQQGGTPRQLSREEAISFLKSKLTTKDPDGSYAQLIDLLLAPKKDPNEVKKVADKIAQERDTLPELMG